MNRILLGVDDLQKRNRLAQQLASHYDILQFSSKTQRKRDEERQIKKWLNESASGQNCIQACIVDKPGLSRYKLQLRERRELPLEAQFPVLLVVEERELENLRNAEETEGEHYRGKALYDDIIIGSGTAAELKYRIEKLLRERELAASTLSRGESGIKNDRTESEKEAKALERQRETATLASPWRGKRRRGKRGSREPQQRSRVPVQQLFRLLVEGIRDYAIVLLDAEGEIISWNRGAERILGYQAREIMGEHFSRFYPPEDIQSNKPEKELQLVATAGQCEDEGWRIRKNGERFWASMTIAALYEVGEELVGFSAIIHDLSDRKAVEMELCSLNRALTTIWECNQAMVRATRESELLEEICRIIVETGGYRLAWVAFARPESGGESDMQILQPVACAGDRANNGCMFEIWGDEVEATIRLTSQSIRNGKPCVVQNIETDPRLEPWRSAAIARGLYSTISLPLIGKGKAFGALQIYGGITNAFDVAEVQLLEELASDLAYGIMALRDRDRRQKAEAALTKSEERYRQLVELSPEAIVVHSHDKISLINTAGAKLLGAATPAELIGRSMLDFVSPGDSQLRHLLQQVQKQQQPLSFVEVQLIRRDGTIVPVELAATPLGEGGGRKDLLVVARDLSDRKRMEAALRHSEELHRIVLSNISEAVFITDNQGGFTYISPTVSAIFEYSVQQAYKTGNIRKLLGDKLFDAHHLARVGEIHNIERTIRGKSGKKHTLLVSVKRVKIDRGTVLYTCRDITERKQAEVALRASENRFRTTFEGSPIGMSLLNLEGRFIESNAQLQEMLGYRQEELSRKRFAEITHPEDIGASHKLFREMLRAQRDRYQVEQRYISANGSWVWVRVSVSAIRERLSAPQFAIALIEDISERKQAEEELRVHRNHLEELVAERTAELTRTLERLQEEIRYREQAQEALIRVTQAVESTSDAVAMTDMTGRSIYHNRAFLELFNYSVEELNAGGGHGILFRDRAVWEQVFGKIRWGKSWSGEVQMRSRNGSMVSIWLRADAVKDDNHQLVGLICVHTDITKRLQAEAALRESEEQLRTLINAMPDIVCFKDERGGWLEANDAILKIFELEGKDYRGLTDAQLAEMSRSYSEAFFYCERTDEQAWKKGILSHVEEAIGSVNGMARIFDVIKVPLFHADGTRKGLVVLGRDITERKKAEKELLRLASIVESSDDAIIGKTLEGIVLSWNAGAERIYGYTASEMKGQSISRLVLRDRQHSELGLFERIQQGASIDHYETVHLRKDGSQIHVSLTISPIKDPAGRITGVSTIARDVTDLKRVEEALESLRHQNELILNCAGEGICGMDAQGKTTFVNPAAAKMLGYPPGELLGAPLGMILHKPLTRGSVGRDRPRENALGDREPRAASNPQQLAIAGDVETPEILASPLYGAIRDGAVHQGANQVFWRKDGSCFPVEYITTPIQEQGKIVGAVLTFKDITERLAVERMKDEFISVVSHELRTPLTSIRGSLGLLAGGLLTARPEKASRMLEIAVSNTDRLVRLINDILDLERIESGKVTMVYQLCNAADLMLQAADALRSMAMHADVRLSVTPLDLSLQADPDRIFQVLTNLLSNAIKFSPEGETVWLSAAIAPRAESIAFPESCQSESTVATLDPRSNRDSDRCSAPMTQPTVCFHIRDRGRGIPPEKLESIFERFQQVDASDSRKKGGTGLGLAICRSIVEHHGGRIWAASVVGEGSSFYFTLPLHEENL
ncbi:PAS domain S-box protein [Phormidium sp. CCY1219]|uniref:PAS domain S-box protein n=1 Tax=Phormidium sp. CCY1219 TaxID=2886104 RepID=UPI002D1F9406|nr:PAS domain S-box protein [Phormidium sp. CCY1219]MEB3831348.1 PAS domain S-box protein [Phormidium sp. CCY1219]